MKILIEVTKDDLKDGMVKAYENFAKKGRFRVLETSIFRCTRIEVSKEVDDYFWEYYRKKAKENNKNMTDEEITGAIAMLMLQNGAKRNESLKPWTVTMEDDFVINED